MAGRILCGHMTKLLQGCDLHLLCPGAPATQLSVTHWFSYSELIVRTLLRTDYVLDREGVRVC